MRLWGLGAALGLAALAAGCDVDPAVTGRADFDTICAGCHGADGRGDGPAAASLDTQPADLTGIAARNGGRFPLVPVMARIDGYARGGATQHSDMPAFWPLLEGDMVLVETGPGVMTPTPRRLVALARYLASIQVTDG